MFSFRVSIPSFSLDDIHMLILMRAKILPGNGKNLNGKFLRGDYLARRNFVAKFPSPNFKAAYLQVSKPSRDKLVVKSSMQNLQWSKF